MIDVFQDRYAGLSGSGFRGGFRGGSRGFRGGPRGGFRGGLRGGYSGGGESRSFDDSLYKPYSGPDQEGPTGPAADYTTAPGYGPGPGAGASAAYGGFVAEPSQQIMVRNASIQYLSSYSVC